MKPTNNKIELNKFQGFDLLDKLPEEKMLNSYNEEFYNTLYNFTQLYTTLQNITKQIQNLTTVHNTLHNFTKTFYKQTLHTHIILSFHDWDL